MDIKMDSDVLSEMASFKFCDPFKVEIVSDEEEDDEKDQVVTDSNFYSSQSPKNKNSIEPVKNDKSNGPTKEIKATRPTVLRILKEKISTKNSDSDSSIREHFIKKKKKKSKKSKKDKKVKESKSKNKNYRCTLRSLDPIDMDPVVESTNPDLNTTKNVVEKDKPNKEEMNEDIFQKKNDINEQPNQYINDLLAKVSESLIHVLQGYYNHVANVRQWNNSDPIQSCKNIQDSKRRYARLKHHYFQLSYCTTNIIILSRENDTEFTDSFLRNTVKLAELKSIKITVQQIQPFYYELISWAKQKKELQNLPLSPSVPAPVNDLPYLRKFLSQPVIPISVPTSLNNYNATPKVSIHNSNSHTREIKITLEPNLQNNRTNPNNPPAYGSRQQYDNTAQPGFHATEQRNSSLDQNYYNFYMNRPPNYEPRHSYRPNVTEVTATTANIFKDSVANQNGCPVVNCFCQNQNNADVSNSMNTRFPTSLPAYEQLADWKHLVNNNTQFEDFSGLNNVETTRSSSTDSGFISPQQQISPMESMTQIIEDIQNAAAGTPLITHVTSLNPKALQIIEGSCHVCGSTTKKKCLGCYQLYYCSYQCQRLDWTQHMNLCKKVSRQPQNLHQLLLQ